MNESTKKQIEKITDFYKEEEKSVSKTEELIRLDKKVKRPALIFSYLFGIIGSLILGTGMCLAMKVIGDLFVLGIVVGIIGIVAVSITYPIHKKILSKRKDKYAFEIIELSKSILNNED